MSLDFDNDVTRRYPQRRDVVDVFDSYYAQKAGLEAGQWQPSRLDQAVGQKARRRVGFLMAIEDTAASAVKTEVNKGLQRGLSKAQAEAEALASTAVKNAVNRYKNELKRLAEPLSSRGLLNVVGVSGVPTSPSQIPAAAAGFISKELGIPIPTKLTPDGLLSAAKGLGLSLPFPLPTKFPTNANDFIDLGLQTANQFFGPQLLTFVGLSGVVPGVGWAVSVGKAIAALIEYFLSAKGEAKARYKCYPRGFLAGRQLRPGEQSFVKLFPEDIAKATPVLQAAWYQAAMSEARGVQLTPTLRSLYRKGAIQECVDDMRDVIRLLGANAGGGTSAETQYALRMFDWIKRAYPRVPLEPSSARIVEQLVARAAVLEKERVEVVDTLKIPVPVVRGKDPAAASRISQRLSAHMLLMGRVLTTVRDAAVHVQTSAGSPYWSKENLKSFAQITSRWNALEQRKFALIAAMNTAMAHKELPRTEAGLKTQQFRFELEGCGGNSTCEARVRIKYGSPPASAPPAPAAAPAPAPRPAPRQPTLTPQQRLQAVAAQWRLWLKGARADQIARRPVRPPPPIGAQNPPGTPPVWVAWLAQARAAQAARRPVPFPPAIPAAWTR